VSMSTLHVRLAIVASVWSFAAGCGPEAIEFEHADGGTGGTSTSAGTGSGAGVGGTGGMTTNGGGGGTETSLQSGDRCTTTCGEGLECFTGPSGETGRCAPLCEDQNQSAWGGTCENPLTGGAGTCLPFFDHTGRAVVAIGLCTSGCDPLAQDCPEGFTCDVTEDEAGQAPDRIFACLPLTEAEPLVQGDGCNGFPTGECGPGLSCISGLDPAHFATCERLCDSTAAAPCSAQQACEIPDFFPPGTTVGICVD
jgi:hypothetical protein